MFSGWRRWEKRYRWTSRFVGGDKDVFSFEYVEFEVYGSFLAEIFMLRL